MRSPFSPRWKKGPPRPPPGRALKRHEPRPRQEHLLGVLDQPAQPPVASSASQSVGRDPAPPQPLPGTRRPLPEGRVGRPRGGRGLRHRPGITTVALASLMSGARRRPPPGSRPPRSASRSSGAGRAARCGGPAILAAARTTVKPGTAVPAVPWPAAAPARRRRRRGAAIYRFSAAFGDRRPGTWPRLRSARPVEAGSHPAFTERGQEPKFRRNTARSDTDNFMQLGFNWSSQHPSAPIAAPRQVLRLAFSSRASCAAGR